MYRSQFLTPKHDQVRSFRQMIPFHQISKKSTDILFIYLFSVEKKQIYDIYIYIRTLIGVLESFVLFVWIKRDSYFVGLGN